MLQNYNKVMLNQKEKYKLIIGLSIILTVSAVVVYELCLLDENNNSKFNLSTSGNTYQRLPHSSIMKPDTRNAVSGNDAKSTKLIQRAAENLYDQQLNSKSQLAAILDPYSDLMTDLGIADSVQQKVLSALESYDDELREQMTLTATRGSPPPIKAFKDMEDRRDQKLRAALGDEQYNKYKQNIDTIPERIVMRRIQNRLESIQSKLDDQQSEILFQAMVKAARSQDESNTIKSELKTAPSTGPVNDRFQRVAQAMRDVSSDFSEGQKAEINKYIEQTIEMRSRLKRKF
jgi:hypothetical protein